MFTVKKIDNTECYLVKEEGSFFNSAYFFLNDKQGKLSVLSNYGHFTLDWGTSIRELLLNTDLERLMWYLSAKEFDFNETIKNIRKYILERRKTKRCDKCGASFAWELINDIDENFHNCDVEFFLGYMTAHYPELELNLKCEFSYILALLMAYKWSDNDEFFKNKFLKPFIEQLKRGVGAC